MHKKDKHENHNMDENTFNHYPENMKLTKANQMIACGVNKHKQKLELGKNTCLLVVSKNIVTL